MNQGRIWCVVKPTVGLPLFLGSVAVIALLVHYALLSHTTYFSKFWGGRISQLSLSCVRLIKGSGAAKPDPRPIIGVDQKAANEVRPAATANFPANASGAPS
jgi:light-harvesting protein B-800-850 alpha chain